MSVILATNWYPSSGLYSNWLATVVTIATLACSVASLKKFHTKVLGQLMLVVAAPTLFVTVLFSEAGMFVLKDGKEFGFPIWARAYPNADDFLATYAALGASYLLARKATLALNRAIRFAGWIEAIGFVSMAVFELFLLGRRIYLT